MATRQADTAPARWQMFGYLDTCWHDAQGALQLCYVVFLNHITQVYKIRYNGKMNKIRSSFKKRKADMLLVGGLVLIAALLWVIFQKENSGAYVVVRVEGEVVARYSLSEDLDTVIKGENGRTNHLRIANGEVFLSEASCPDKLCVSQGRISNVGAAIICLPNQVVLEISGKDEEGYDIIR